MFCRVECPLSVEDRRRLFPCVSPDQFGFYICIDDHALCDSVRHCPNGEDEDGTVCMFHRMVSVKIVPSACRRDVLLCRLSFHVV